MKDICIVIRHLYDSPTMLPACAPLIADAEPRPDWEGEAPPLRNACEWIGDFEPTHRGWRDRSFWQALGLAVMLTGGAFALFCTVLTLAAAAADPPLLVAWGDSDRIGLQLGMVEIEEKVYRQGDANTVGGDDRNGPIEAVADIPPVDDLPLKQADEEKLLVTVEPRILEKLTIAPPVAVEASAEDVDRKITSTRTQPSSNLPGAPGGAQRPVGTPSRGGVAGSAAGLRLIGRGPSIYPDEARRRGIEGRVVVWLRISPQGRVAEVRVHESSGHASLDNAALEHSQTLRFAPLAEGTVVLHPVRFTIPR